MTSDDVVDFLAGRLADTETGWSVGTFGAIAEFTRDAREPASLDRTAASVAVVTARGGMRIEPKPDMRLIASESLTAESWSHRVALCLPRDASAMNGRTALTEVGPDIGALRTEDRDSVLFDLGLGTLQVDVCIRSQDPGTIAALRNCAGKSVFAHGNDAMPIILTANPHRVFLSRIGRAEVFQPIPPPGGKSPDGPHTHVLPKLLAHGRTHAATEPLPEGWVPCAHLYPPHPLRDPFGKARPFRRDHHAAFQVLLERHGDVEIVALKRQVADAVKAQNGPESLSLPQNRLARTALRIALRQLQAEQPSLGLKPLNLKPWLDRHDRPGPADAEDPMEALH
jgi:Family of unknown function (DUF6925)